MSCFAVISLLAAEPFSSKRITEDFLFCFSQRFYGVAGEY